MINYIFSVIQNFNGDKFVTLITKIYTQDEQFLSQIRRRPKSSEQVEIREIDVLIICVV
jgi:hypothetical protein